MTDQAHNTDGFYLDRRGQRELVVILGGVPSLAEDLMVTLTKQSRTARREMASRPRKRESALPLHMGAAHESAELHNCLTTWVRAVCEQRSLDYDGTDDVIGLARWLRRWIIALAMTEGADDALPEIKDQVARCRRITDIPPEDEVVIDQDRLRRANRQVLTAGQVERIAGQLGEIGRGLTKGRVETLAKRKHIHPAAIDGKTRFFRFGDVLDAHLRHARNPGTPRSGT